MGHNEEQIQNLESQGYDPVYVWDAEPNEEDPDHAHTFDTHLVILEGEILIRINKDSKILKSGETIDIPSGKVHYGKVGESGCKYIVAERH